MTAGQATTAVRHEIDSTKLEAYLVENVTGFKAPFELQQFAFGQSNPTYLLIDANNTKYVVRKKPPGQILSRTAHAVEREYKILSALSKNTDLPVPKVYCLCEDSDIIGTPFYVMEFVNGRIYTEVHFKDLPPKERRDCWNSAVSTLAKLHSTDFRKIGLGDYGKDSGFYARQIKSLGRISQIQSEVTNEQGVAVGELPGFKKILTWFSKHLSDDTTSLIHG
ncbi:hypothetical protein K7432_013237, partial [Basidiobolus ranarum]